MGPCRLFSSCVRKVFIKKIKVPFALESFSLTRLLIVNKKRYNIQKMFKDSADTLVTATLEDLEPCPPYAKKGMH